VWTALAALALAAGCSDPERPVAPKPGARVPLWRQPPDKPPGPPLPTPRGRAASFALVPVAHGFRQPVQVLARPGSRRLYVVEQAGMVRALAGRRPAARPYLDIRDEVLAGGERGLLTAAFSAGGGALLVMFTDEAGDTRVVQYRAGATRADEATARTLLAVAQPYENHNGGTLLFDPHGRLLLGLGDGGSAFDPDHRAQDPGQRLGKILRYVPDLPEGGWRVVALGLRNPWRMSFDRATGRLWLGDAGQDRVEEIDAVTLPEEGQRPLNLGWPAFEGDRPLGRKPLSGGGRLTWPVAGYDHAEGCAVTGGHVYRGRAVPALRGRYVFGDFCTGTLWSLDARDAATGRGADLRRETATLPGLTSFGEDRRGELYAVSQRGSVHRLAPARRPSRGRG
jgi:glucose/arabinose dehydrogenase